MQKREKFISEREFSKIASQDRRDRYAAIIDSHYRRQKEWTLEALAEKLGYNIGLLRRRMQHGEPPSFTIQDLAILTEAFGTEVIETIVQDCGGVFVQVPEAFDQDPTDTVKIQDAILTLSKRLGDLADEIRKATSPYSHAGTDISPCEAKCVRKAIRELQQDAAALDLVMVRLEGKP